MPVYDYKCQTHGVLYGLAAMAESDKPCACPKCGTLCARIIRMSPNVFKMSPEKKKAYNMNDRNQHELIVSSAARRDDDEVHTKGCGCARPMGKSKLMYTAQGDKIFPSMRPCTISH